MSRTLWANRNPDWKDREGKPIYDRRAKVRIWTAKLQAEFFPTRKPSPTESVKLSAAVCLVIDLCQAHASFGATQALPKNYLTKFNALQRILQSFKPKTTRGKKATAKDSGPSLAAILGDEV